jgi:hypothetical protein
MLSAHLTAQRAKKVFDLIRTDIEAGLYDHAPGRPIELGSWLDLHDFVDANEYLEEVCGEDAAYDEYDAVSYLVDVLLFENPIPLV